MKFHDIPADILTFRIKQTDNAPEALQEIKCGCGQSFSVPLSFAGIR